MNMPRPETDCLVDLKNPPYGRVLKREFSDFGRDVYIPDLAEITQQAEIQRAADFIKGRMAEGKNDECSWLSQERAPFLSVGEIRFMCVGGVPVRETVTGNHPMDHPRLPGEPWSYERNDSLKTLAALQ